MGGTVRGWRQAWRSASNSQVFDSNARGRNGWKWKFPCFQQAILYLFQENWATYKRSSKFPLQNSSFSAAHAKDNLSGPDNKGRCCVIAPKTQTPASCQCCVNPVCYLELETDLFRVKRLSKQSSLNCFEREPGMNLEDVISVLPVFLSYKVESNGRVQRSPTSEVGQGKRL